MGKIGQTLKGYIWWTYSRGSLHYDVMVSLILLFIFLSPHYIDFHDKPAERLPRPHTVTVLPDGERGFIFRVDARDVPGKADDEKLANMRSVIEPIASSIKIDRWAPEYDTHGELVGYHVWAHR
jgi:hypothetical protein